MKKIFAKAAAVIACLLLFSLFAAGCSGTSGSNVNRTETVKVELTQRQINILEGWGLSTNYDELTMGQKSAIESVETMMRQLESKYGKSFDFISYTPADMGEPETLLACEDGNIMFPITVTRKAVDGKIVYSDNYGMVQLIPEFMEEMDALVAGVCGGKAYVLSPEPVALIDADAGNALLACSSNNIILISDADYDEDGMNAFLADLLAAASEKGLNSSTEFRVFLIPAEAFASATMFNYSDILAANLFAPHAISSVN